MLAAEPVLVDPQEGPEAALELRAALDDFMRVSQECRGAEGGAIACMCAGDAVPRLQGAMASVLEQHPGWRERPLQYTGEDSRMLISIPALREEISVVTSQCGG